MQKPPSPHRNDLPEIVQALMDWFAQAGRDLPWRHTSDPYAIWISEVMLQQTQVQTVIPYWQRWMKLWPNARALAKADLERVLKAWEGLGYYTRARSLHRAANLLVAQSDGQFPRTLDEVRALPGIGPYTAGAICSLAYNQPTPVLDGNVIRVLCRLSGIRQNVGLRKTQQRLWTEAEELVRTAANIPPQLNRWAKSGNCSSLNQSLMELGATICTPRTPSCRECPVQRFCVTQAKGWQRVLPRLVRKPTVVRQTRIAVVLEAEGRFLVRRRPEKSVNGGLWEFPNFDAETEYASANCIFPNLKSEILNLKSETHGAHGEAQSFVRAFGLEWGALRPMNVIQHSITRYRITLEVYRGNLHPSSLILHPSSLILHPSTLVPRPSLHPPGVAGAGMPQPGEEFLWLTCQEMARLPFASAHRRILGMLLEAEPDGDAIGEQPGNKRVKDREDRVNKKKQPLRALRPRKKL